LIQYFGPILLHQHITHQLQGVKFGQQMAGNVRQGQEVLGTLQRLVQLVPTQALGAQTTINCAHQTRVFRLFGHSKFLIQVSDGFSVLS